MEHGRFGRKFETPRFQRRGYYLAIQRKNSSQEPRQGPPVQFCRGIIQQQQHWPAQVLLHQRGRREDHGTCQQFLLAAGYESLGLPLILNQNKVRPVRANLAATQLQVPIVRIIDRLAQGLFRAPATSIFETEVGAK